MPVRIMGVGGPQFFERPCAGLDAAALHFFVPLHRAHVLAGLEIRKLRLVVVEENHIVVAAGAARSAPLGAGIGDEAAVLRNFAYQFDRLLPLLGGDVEVVVGEGKDVEAGHVATVGQVVGGRVGADGVLRMNVEVAVINARHGERLVDGDIEALRFDRWMFRQAGGDDQFAGILARQVFQQQHRPAFFRQTRFLVIHRLAIQRGLDADPVATVPAGVAPLIFAAQAQGELLAGAHDARAAPHQLRRRAGLDVDHQVVADGGKARGAERIDIAADAEEFFDKGLYAGAGAAEAAVAEADDDVVAGLQIAVIGIDDHRLLEGPLMAFLIEAHAELLHRGGALPGDGRRGVIFSRDIVRPGRICGLEQRPVGIETKGRLEPGAVGHARRAQLIVDDDFLPRACFHLLDVATDLAQEGHVLGDLIEAGGGRVVAELGLQFGIGHFFHAVFPVFSISVKKQTEPIVGWIGVHCVKLAYGYLNGHGAAGSHTGIPMKAYHGAMTQMP